MKDNIIAKLSDPTAAFLVLLGGLVLVYREITAPGRVLPGVFGGVLAVAALHGLWRWEWRWEGLGLLLAGSALILVYALAVPHWVVGVAAGLVLVPGVSLWIDAPSPIKPAAALLALPFGVMSAVLARWAVHGRRNKRAV